MLTSVQINSNESKKANNKKQSYDFKTDFKA